MRIDIFFTIVLLNNFISLKCFDLVEFLFGPRLQSRIDNLHEDHLLDADGLIRSFGYPSESHRVLTDDGYLLTIHRIPRKAGKRYKMGNPVVLLHHGVLAASDNWLLRGPDKDLPYLLSDAGYDVWLCNARGNYYSRGHVKWNPNTDMEYWRFSYHEMGIYDLPSTIDYILNKTEEKYLYFIGYSMGATASYILCANKPEYNDKLRLIISLAPTAYTNHKLMPFLKLLISAIPPTFKILSYQNIFEFFPRRNITKNLFSSMCAPPARDICLAMMFLVVGVDNEEFEKELFPTMISYYPAGTSILTILHYYQMFTAGSFMPLLMNNATEKSSSFYRNETPYDLSKITAPVALYYSQGDYLVTKEDCEVLGSKLPNLVGLFKIGHKNFNHIDFMWASNTKTLLYDNLIYFMNKYR